MALRKRSIGQPCLGLLRRARVCFFPRFRDGQEGQLRVRRHLHQHLVRIQGTNDATRIETFVLSSKFGSFNIDLNVGYVYKNKECT